MGKKRKAYLVLALYPWEGAFEVEGVRTATPSNTQGSIGFCEVFPTKKAARAACPGRQILTLILEDKTDGAAHTT